jgi:RNA polymerase sigma factor (sigma-70 family)
MRNLLGCTIFSPHRDALRVTYGNVGPLVSADFCCMLSWSPPNFGRRPLFGSRTVSEGSTTLVLQAALDRLRAGDLSARDELIAHSCNRFLLLTRKMLNRYPRLRNWEESGDVSQNALLRMRRALEQVQPASCREFFGLATVQISRELLDLTRHYYGRNKAADSNGTPNDGPAGRVARAMVQGMQGGGSDDFRGDPTDDNADDPLKLAAWREFHEAVQKLPANEREVFELLWYQGLSQEEAADLLGCDRSTIKRRWRGARTNLHGALRGWLPEGDAQA